MVDRKDKHKNKKESCHIFLYWGNQINTPAAICNTPKAFQTIGDILSIIEQGGSKKDKNLSAPTIKKRILQIPTMIFVMFIFSFLWFENVFHLDSCSKLKTLIIFRLHLEERYLKNNSFEKNQLGAAPTALLFYSYWQFYRDVVSLGL